jgi:hypothetical protein
MGADGVQRRVERKLRMSEVIITAAAWVEGRAEGD